MLNFDRYFFCLFFPVKSCRNCFAPHRRTPKGPNSNSNTSGTGNGFIGAHQHDANNCFTERQIRRGGPERMQILRTVWLDYFLLTAYTDVISLQHFFLYYIPRKYNVSHHTAINSYKFPLRTTYFLVIPNFL